MDERARGVARVWGRGSHPVGSAFLVGPRTLLTCTHVVAVARGAGKLVTPPAGCEVEVDFPARPGEFWAARLIACQPVEGDGDGDVAVLELPAEAPPELRPAVLIEAPDLWRHAGGTFGFPRGFDNGTFGSGVLLSVEGTGWLEIDDRAGRPVEPGFSGAPVWDEQYPAGVVGMVVAARTADVAYAIPVRALMAAWPPLAALARPPSPYRGLLPFSAADTEVYCGREEDATELLELVRSEPVVTVVGASGVGKTSLVLAGLAPRLAQEGVVTASVRLQPRMDLARALAPHRDRAGTGRLVVVFDQLDEVLVANPALGRQVDRLVAELTAPGAGGPAVSAVVILRDDFLGYAEKLTPVIWDAWRRQRFALRPMRREQLREAISGPLRSVRPVRLADGLAELILADAPPGPSALPLVEQTMSLLWDRQEHGELTHSAYRQIGGVGAALNEHAESVLSRLTERQQGDARWLFVQLVRPDKLDDGQSEESARDLRRIATHDDLTDAQWTLAHHLAGTRLLATTGGDGTRAGTVELAHEALITAWPRLREWVNQTRSFRLWQDRLLRERLASWTSAGRGADRRRALLRGRELRESLRAIGYARSERYELPERELAFVRRCRLRRRSVRRRGALAALLVVVALAWLPIRLVETTEQQRGTERLRQRSTATQRLMAQAGSARPDNIRKALQLGLAARRLSPGAPGDSGLSGTVTSTPLVATLTAPGGGAEVHGVDFSPDGRVMAATTAKGTLWDIGDPYRPVRAATLGDAGGLTLAFSPVGRILATGGFKGALELWNVADAYRPVRVALRTAGAYGITALAFSGDGRTLATAGADRTVLLWDVTDPRRPSRIAVLRGHDDEVDAVRFAPGGGMIATASADGTVRLWKITARRQPIRLATLPGDIGLVYGALGFSPDGRHLATADLQRVRLWDLADPRHPKPASTLTGHHSRVAGIAHSRSGHLLAVTGWDGRLIVWDVADARHPVIVTTVKVSTLAYGVAISPDGRYLASGGGNGQVSLWDATRLHSPAIPAARLTGHTRGLWGLSLSRDRHLLVTAGWDGTAMVWDITHPDEPILLTTLGARGRNNPSAPALRPDGRVLALGHSDRVDLWDLADPRRPALLETIPDPGLLHQLAFSPRGDLLAGASMHSRALLWDVRDPRRPTHAAEVRHGGNVSGAAFLAGGRILATASQDATFALWDLADHRHPAPVWASPRSRRGFPLEGVAIAPDGRTLAVAGTYGTPEAALWDITDLRRPRRTAILPGETGKMYDVAFSPRGHLLATAESDGSVGVWDTSDPALPIRLISLTGHTGQIQRVAFSPDATVVAAASSDRTATLWDIRWAVRLSGHLPEAACVAAGGELDRTQWQAAVPGIPYEPTC
ncbi:nSTAND1 domain-containing NTPase [Nonomuraea sp. NPDC002799]